ncbi:hypothetical protein PVIIG_04580 [Plasmodium vivax India VII]|uniref:U3 small nucleolar RNA-associated protein 14 n=1 Tax=Plasmodium vivax India VII TaxID=1077284 RepID=A0A0J9SJ14_PLAVI|nr:hypothetical protein PVIIG_04580 [Plasmodium vivax India VII]
MEGLEDASTTLSGGLGERRAKGKKGSKAAAKMARLIERGKIPSLKGKMKRKVKRELERKGQKKLGKKLGKKGERKMSQEKGESDSGGGEEDPTDEGEEAEEDEEAEEEDETELETLDGLDPLQGEEPQRTAKGAAKKGDPSENFIQFLRKYNEQGEEAPKRRRSHGKGNTKGEQQQESGSCPPEEAEAEAEAESYQYLSQRDDVYKIEKPAERVDLDDLIYGDDVLLRGQIGEDINMLTRGQLEKGKSRSHVSVLEEQKMNEQLAYVKNVELINKMNRSFYVIHNAQGVHFGQGGKSAKGQVSSEEFLSKGLLRRRGERSGEGGGEVDGGVGGEVRSEENGAPAPSTAFPEDPLTALEFEREMQTNLRTSKMLIVSDDVLKTEREKKRDELKKIAQLKALLQKEERKNKYKKRIKSKAYRRHLRMKEKKEEERILAKLQLEHPDLADSLANYEKEYAQKRNLISNVKKRKTVRLLNRYKNEELKKQMLRSFQAEKEEKNMLRRIIERVVVEGEEEEAGGGSGDDKRGGGPREEDQLSGDEVDASPLSRKSKVRKELQKRNLERFAFVKNAEERKRDEEVYQQRKRLLDKVERVKGETGETDEKDPMASCSSDEGSDAERARRELGLSNEVRRSSEKEASKARAQLAKDADLANALRKGGILGTGGDALEEPEEVVPLEEAEGVPPLENPPGESPLGEDPPAVRDLHDIDAIDAMGAVDEGIAAPNSGEHLTVYNFENEVYEDYVNLNPEAVEGKVPREDDELLQLSEDERVTTERVSEREWCNYETLLELERKKVMKEKELIERKKKIPIHTISVFNRKDKKFAKYLVDKVPYPYERNDYERTLNINLNKEVNDISAHAKLVAPRVSNRVGNIVSPLVRNPFEIARILTLKRGKNRSKL